MEDQKNSNIKISFEDILKEYGNRKINEQDTATISERLEKLKGKKFSDIISYDKNTPDSKLYWVDFVQQGGGTLGISLVGYTFVLEYLGIRFLKLAGTSAGAINTIFMAAIGEKDDPKTPELYEMMTDKTRFDMKTFMDTKNCFIRWLLLSLGKGKGLILNFLNLYVVILLMVLIPLPFLSHVGFEGKVVYGFFMSVFVIMIAYLVFLLSRFSKDNFGINPGDKFESFLERELKKFGVESQSDLDKKAKFEIEFTKIPIDSYVESVCSHIKFKLYVGDKPLDKDSIESYTNLAVDYSFVTTDINNECKIVFPQESELYFEIPAQENPAKYVRASMAIPFFFEPKIVQTQHKIYKGKPLWEIMKGIKADKVRSQGIFIDGGSLSNFPINLFHNPKIGIPRFPIFGVRIVDERPVKISAMKLTFGNFIGKIVNTLRNNEDNSFLAINPFYKKYCIAEIKAYETDANWLNFNLTDEQKKALFIEGIEAGLCFLENFNWDTYKQERNNINDTKNN